jgi:hypothetical protein
MDIEMDRRRVDAEAERQQQELTREAAARERVAAEESRVSAEDGRRAAADEVRETIATLTTLLIRMEAVEALRRDARTRFTRVPRQVALNFNRKAPIPCIGRVFAQWPSPHVRGHGRWVRVGHAHRRVGRYPRRGFWSTVADGALGINPGLPVSKPSYPASVSPITIPCSVISNVRRSLL